MTDQTPSLEERLLAALNKRGEMTLGRFIADAINSAVYIRAITDDTFVQACEQYAKELETNRPE